MTFANSERRTDDGVSGATLGRVIAVTGSRVGIGLLPRRADASASTATVGRFIGLRSARSTIVAMVTAATADVPAGVRAQGFDASATADLLGEIRIGDDGTSSFRRGVSDFPAIGDAAVPLDARDLRLVYAVDGPSHGSIGRLHLDDQIEALVDVNGLVDRHFAVLGATGVGKSSAMAVLLDRVMQQRADLRIFLLDSHDEYGRCFGDRANLIDSHSLKLPFWLFNFEEMADVIFGGRPAVAEELEILAEVIPLAKGMYSQYKATERGLRRKSEARNGGYTSDMPVPYLVQDLLSLIDERMGRLENRAARMHFHRLSARIDAIRNDPHYAFMFENANVGGDTMAELLTHLFRLDPQGKPISVMQLGRLPVETVDAVVCVLCRLAFDLGLWSDGRLPLLVVCEEAHRYASSDAGAGFRPTRGALTRIAREGRKYGVFLGLVTQRPAELDSTIIAQCGTLFAMRMTNDHDQALLRSAVSDAAADLLGFVPTLGAREAVAFGEGVPLPARIRFARVADDRLPRHALAGDLPGMEADPTDISFVRSVVERWRTHRGRAETDDAETVRPPIPTASGSEAHEFRALRQRVETAVGRKDPRWGLTMLSGTPEDPTAASAGCGSTAAPVLLDAVLRALPVGVELRRPDGCLVLRAGAADPSDPEGAEILRRRIAIDGEDYDLATTLDLSRQRRSEAVLFRHAYYDDLTGLPNRRHLETVMGDRVSRPDPETAPGFALAFIDIDNFKHINDYYGHAVGDDILVKVSRRIVDELGRDDLLARIGGDEFVLLLNARDDGAPAMIEVERLLERLKQPFYAGGLEIFTSVSIGVSLFPAHGRDYETLRRHADLALYRTKRGRKGAAALFDDGMRMAARERTETEQRLRLALRDRRFLCAYQPKVDIRTGQTVGLEVLLRWRDDNGVIQPPGEFLALAIELGLIDDVTRSVLDETVGALPDLDRLFGPQTSISINVAARQAADLRFMAALVGDLRATGHPKRFMIEFTEEAFFAKSALQQTILPMLRDIGTKVSIDDFGAGYSSLSALTELAADELKIDRAFLTDIHRRPRSQSLLKAIESLGHALGMSVVAEGIETHEELTYLSAATRIRYAQGYYFAKPQTLDELTGGRTSVHLSRAEAQGRRPSATRVAMGRAG